MDRQKLNAGSVTREVKKQLRLAALPAYRVTTRYTRVTERTPAGRTFGWQSIVHDLDAESVEVVELVMGNLSGLVEVSRHMQSDSSGFLSIITEDQ